MSETVIVPITDNTCPLCTKKCKTAAGLSKHMQVHVERAEGQSRGTVT